MKLQSFKIVQWARRHLPVSQKHYMLYELTQIDANWYSEQLKQAYFNENIVYKVDESQASAFVNMYLKCVRPRNSLSNQIRLIIKRFQDEACVGGISLFYKSKSKTIELGYWVLPEYQGMGIMSEILPKILDTLNEFLDDSFQIHLEIFASNKVSKDIAIRNKFFEISRKTSENNPDIIVYGMDRKLFKIMMESCR